MPYTDLLHAAPDLSTCVVAGLPGGTELWVILFIVLILFGRRLPGVARSLGQGISSFKKGLNEPLDEGEKKDDDKPAETPKVEAQADAPSEKKEPVEGK